MSPRRWLPAAAALAGPGPGPVRADVRGPAPRAPASGRPRPSCAPASDPGIEAQFVSRINSLRASKGLRQLQVSGELVGVARSWTDHMVGQGQISHNPNLGSQVGGGWTKLGENVGVGYDVDGLMQAFINSPAHYRNLVDPAWTHVGVGVSHASDGRIYTTHNFMALRGGGRRLRRRRRPSPPATEPAARRPTTAPRRRRPPRPPRPRRPRRSRTPTTERVTAVLDPLRSLEADVKRARLPAMPAAIETHDLTRSFPSGVALDGLTLEVQPGEVLALLGPNGAGKTTTVRLLNGILTPDRGRASVLGLDPATHGDDVRRRTGVLTEHAGLDERLTARENLTLTGRMRGLDRAWVERRTDELLERFGMADRADLPVQGTSTGQRKRLALARALLHDPEVLFLDEPTSGLDPTATRDVIDLIGSLATEHGRTVVLATHFLGEAGRLANRMAVLHRGVLHAFGRPEDIAAELWHGVDAELDLGGPADDGRPPTRCGAPAACSMVAPSPTGAIVRVTDREVVPHLVRLLVAQRGVRCTAPAPGRRRSRTCTSRSRPHRRRRGPPARPAARRGPRAPTSSRCRREPLGHAGDHRQGPHRGAAVEGRRHPDARRARAADDRAAAGHRPGGPQPGQPRRRPHPQLDARRPGPARSSTCPKREQLVVLSTATCWRRCSSSCR